MTRAEIISELKNYFDLKELVCPHILQSFGDKGWMFLRTELLHTLLIVRRDILKARMTINNYPKGTYTQRGIRCNICKLTREKTLKDKIYMSAHSLAGADDFDAEGYTAEESRNLIRSNSDKLPYPIRLEKNVNWVHLDVYDTGNGQIINEFEA